MQTHPINNVDQYLDGFPEPMRTLLSQLRTAIREAAPDAEEVISYQMPAYRFHGMLVYFAGHRNHIGFYPGTSGIEAFKPEVSGFKGAKGTVQFPPDRPLPLGLVREIVAFRVAENLEKFRHKSAKKSARKPAR
jgi:uncharacterized protein YdhG (YjbR/CyaY superfamily)